MLRKSSRIAFFLFTFMVFGFWSAVHVLAFSGSGSGTSGSPYQITTCSQLNEMGNNLSASYRLMNTVDCTGVSFTPVGNSSTMFTGTFDGQSFSIANLTITSSDYAGLIGAANGATVKNVRIISGSVTGTGSATGGIMGYNEAGSVIDNCSSQMTLTGASYVGGILGLSNHAVTISKSSYTGTASITNTGYVGGLVGILNTGASTINDSYAAGSYTASSGVGYAGGIIGIINSATGTTVTNTYSTASIAMNGSTGVGGLVGIMYTGTLSNSFAATTLTGSATNFGGIAGIFSGGTSSNNYFDSAIAGTTNCAGSGSPSCSAINGTSTPNYFKGNNTNAPLNLWDFANTWLVNNGSYPTLGKRSVSVSSSSSSSTPGPVVVTCTTSAPSSAPNLFSLLAKGGSVTLFFAPVNGGNTKYVISYGQNPTADMFATSFDWGDISGVVPYSVNALYPGTWYFKVRGQNGCMPGNWSGVMSVKVR